MLGRRLEDIAIIIMGQSPSGEMCNVIRDGLPLLNGPTEFGSHHPTPIQFTIDARKIAQRGDLLFCVRGSTTGRMNWADQQYAIGRGIAAIRHKKGEDLQPFIRAVIVSYLPSLLQAATGSTFPNVSASQLYSLIIPDLSEEIQRKISSLIGALDEKIELNRQMNETLEATARLFFKDWFVDFGPTRAKAEGRPAYLAPELWSLFPDALNDDDKPTGWKVSTIGEDFRLLMGQSPPGETYNDNENGLPFFQGRTDFGIRYPKRRIFCNAPTRFAEVDDTLVSVRAPVGDLNMASLWFSFLYLPSHFKHTRRSCSF